MPHWTPADMPDLTGRVAVVTGASSGIGFHTALEFARHGARTLLACRTVAKAEHALERITEAVPSARGGVEILQMDLASLESVEDAAAELADRTAAVDILVNNAGVLAPSGRVTTDGFELQFGVNHLGHFAFTGRVLSLLLAAESPRVVTVSSVTHRKALAVWDFERSAGLGTAEDGGLAAVDGGTAVNMAVARSVAGSGKEPDAGRAGRWSAYGRSKLANLLFSRELDRRAKRAGSALVSVAAHPGYSATELLGKTTYASHSNVTTWLSGLIVRLTAQSPAAGAWPTLYGATRLGLVGGEYIGPRGPGELRGAPADARISRLAQDEETSRVLWDQSVAATGVGYEEFG
jgi:NAD(P)-dependent dehydrogenase (short-subunit alcohol dehydrogenase family)